MMLVLALRSDAAPTVYEAALRYFTPDELAEAFAATSAASPTQPAGTECTARPCPERFRAMAPACRPIGLRGGASVGSRRSSSPSWCFSSCC